MGVLSRLRWCSLGCLIGAFIFLCVAVFVPGQLTNAVRWVADNDFGYKLRALTGQGAVEEPALVEMVVEAIGVSKIDGAPVVILKEKSGERYLPIWIGLAEANAISVVLEGVAVERPLTSDLLRSVIDKLGARVDSIVINDLRDNTFYASIFISVNWMRMEIDSRPSDAIAIAVRVRAPIYAEEAVLEKAGVPLEQETDKPIIMHIQSGRLASASGHFIFGGG